MTADFFSISEQYKLLTSSHFCKEYLLKAQWVKNVVYSTLDSCNITIKK